MVAISGQKDVNSCGIKRINMLKKEAGKLGNSKKRKKKKKVGV